MSLRRVSTVAFFFWLFETFSQYKETYDTPDAGKLTHQFQHSCYWYATETNAKSMKHVSPKCTQDNKILDWECQR